ncbi:FAD-binding oxidoreductase [Sedimentitalea todarodis]|uniref:D-lactate dehydrogenase (cytochrome) n=1 Tax=Sedimentitalea todarodis TaxID=1631240 RepID=A0ABU3VDC5_9RHOB|nr:FAD-linked oxidase C-terminal domain-containing protein [Sedimentitalea todarodis]MDU9004185.1 FAD-linked oxidase C-terminal domain-containing protein [Sedimentitalea todarodis]
MVQATDLPRNEDGIASALGILKQQFGDRFQTGDSIREQHGHTTTWIRNQPPDGVVFPRSTDEVADVIKVCATHKVPLIPFGVGTSLEGHVNAPAGGISMDLGQMNEILAVYPEDLNCVVQPGVTREQLNTYLRDQGLFFPIDPGANATIGGMTATRASGTNAVRYGTMKDNVIALEVVMANGDIIKTAQRAKKSSAGYDLTRLMVGSEGTLGVITKVTLRLQGIPEAMSSARCSFETVDAACQAVMATIQFGVPVARMELLDTASVEAVNAYSKLDLPVSPLLLLEFHGSEASVAEQSATFGEIAEDAGGTGFEWTTNAEERNRLWQARHDYYWATLQISPGKTAIATDVCVPISRLAECVARNNEMVEELGLTGMIVGHVGDGNFHTTLLVDMEDQDEIARADTFVGRLNELAISMDGTCTGEHGIGQGKRPYLTQELGASTRYMAAIKAAFDPDNILNPGKVLPD